MMAEVLEAIQNGSFDPRKVFTGDEEKFLEVKTAIENVSNNLPKEACLNLLVKKIIPVIFDKNFNNAIRNHVVEVGLCLLKYVNITNLPDSEQEILCSQIKEKYINVVGELLSSNYCNWDKLWIFLIHFTHTKLYKKSGLANNLLRIVEGAFRNSTSTDQRLKAYDCWIELIRNASLDMTHMCSPRQIKLLVTPVKAKLSRVPSLIVKRFDTFLFLLEKLGNKSTLCLKEFLESCFGPISEDADRTKQGKSVPEVCARSTKILMEIIGHCHGNDNCLIDEPVTLKQPIIDQKNFADFANIIIFSVFECFMLLSQWNKDLSKNNTIIKCLWQSLKSLINNNNNYFNELINNLNRISKVCDHENQHKILAVVIEQVIEDKGLTECFREDVFNLTLKLLQQYSIYNTERNLCFIFSCLDTEDDTRRFSKMASNCFQSDVKWINEQSMCEIWLKCDIPTTNMTSLIWPVTNLHHFKDVKTFKLKWLKLYNECKSESMKLAFLQEIEKLFLANPLLSSNMIFIIDNISIIEKNPSTNFVSKFMQLIKSVLSLPNISNSDLKILETIILCHFSPALNFYTSDNNEEAIQKLCACLEQVVMIHKVYVILQDLVNRLKRHSPPNLVKISKYITNFLETLMLNEDDVITNNARKVIEAIDLKKQEKIEKTMPSARSLRIVSMANSNIKVDNHTSQVNALKLFGKDVETSSPLAVKGSPLINSSVTCKKVKSSSTHKNKITPSLEDDDSANYVKIDTEVKFDPKKLSEHQKEVLRRRPEDIPALYEDLSQNTSSSSETVKGIQDEKKENSSESESFNKLFKTPLMVTKRKQRRSVSCGEVSVAEDGKVLDTKQAGNENALDLTEVSTAESEKTPDSKGAVHLEKNEESRKSNVQDHTPSNKLKESNYEAGTSSKEKKKNENPRKDVRQILKRERKPLKNSPITQWLRSKSEERNKSESQKQQKDDAEPQSEESKQEQEDANKLQTTDESQKENNASKDSDTIDFLNNDDDDNPESLMELFEKFDRKVAENTLFQQALDIKLAELDSRDEEPQNVKVVVQKIEEVFSSEPSISITASNSTEILKPSVFNLEAEKGDDKIRKIFTPTVRRKRKEKHVVKIDEETLNMNRPSSSKQDEVKETSSELKEKENMNRSSSSKQGAVKDTLTSELEEKENMSMPSSSKQDEVKETSICELEEKENMNRSSSSKQDEVKETSTSELEGKEDMNRSASSKQDEVRNTSSELEKKGNMTRTSSYKQDEVKETSTSELEGKEDMNRSASSKQDEVMKTSSELEKKGNKGGSNKKRDNVKKMTGTDNDDQQTSVKKITKRLRKPTEEQISRKRRKLTKEVLPSSSKNEDEDRNIIQEKIDKIMQILCNDAEKVSDETENKEEISKLIEGNKEDTNPKKATITLKRKSRDRNSSVAKISNEKQNQDMKSTTKKNQVKSDSSVSENNDDDKHDMKNVSERSKNKEDSLKAVEDKEVDSCLERETVSPKKRGRSKSKIDLIAQMVNKKQKEIVGNTSASDKSQIRVENEDNLPGEIEGEERPKKAISVGGRRKISKDNSQNGDDRRKSVSRRSRSKDQKTTQSPSNKKEKSESPNKTASKKAASKREILSSSDEVISPTKRESEDLKKTASIKSRRRTRGISSTEKKITSPTKEKNEGTKKSQDKINDEIFSNEQIISPNKEKNENSNETVTEKSPNKIVEISSNEQIIPATKESEITKESVSEKSHNTIVEISSNEQIIPATKESENAKETVTEKSENKINEISSNKEIISPTKEQNEDFQRTQNKVDEISVNEEVSPSAKESVTKKRRSRSEVKNENQKEWTLRARKPVSNDPVKTVTRKNRRRSGSSVDTEISSKVSTTSSPKEDENLKRSRTRQSKVEDIILTSKEEKDNRNKLQTKNEEVASFINKKNEDSDNSPELHNEIKSSEDLFSPTKSEKKDEKVRGSASPATPVKESYVPRKSNRNRLSLNRSDYVSRRRRRTKKNLSTSSSVTDETSPGDKKFSEDIIESSQKTPPKLEGKILSTVTKSDNLKVDEKSRVTKRSRSLDNGSTSQRKIESFFAKRVKETVSSETEQGVKEIEVSPSTSTGSTETIQSIGEIETSSGSLETIIIEVEQLANEDNPESSSVDDEIKTPQKSVLADVENCELSSDAETSSSTSKEGLSSVPETSEPEQLPSTDTINGSTQLPETETMHSSSDLPDTKTVCFSSASKDPSPIDSQCDSGSCNPSSEKIETEQLPNTETINSSIPQDDSSPVPSPPKSATLSHKNDLEIAQSNRKSIRLCLGSPEDERKTKSAQLSPNKDQTPQIKAPNSRVKSIIRCLEDNYEETPSSSKTFKTQNDLPSSPVTCDTPDRTVELLSITSDISPITAESVAEETPRSDLGLRSSRMLQMIGLTRDSLSFMNSPSSSRAIKPRLMRKEEQLDILTFSREIPSPLIVPQSGILKRKLAQEGEGVTPPSKRKRVNFPDPAITEKKIFIKDSEEYDDSAETAMPMKTEAESMDIVGDFNNLLDKIKDSDQLVDLLLGALDKEELLPKIKEFCLMKFKDISKLSDLQDKLQELMTSLQIPNIVQVIAEYICDSNLSDSQNKDGLENEIWNDFVKNETIFEKFLCNVVKTLEKLSREQIHKFIQEVVKVFGEDKLVECLQKTLINEESVIGYVKQKFTCDKMMDLLSDFCNHLETEDSNRFMVKLMEFASNRLPFEKKYVNSHMEMLEKFFKKMTD